jgi:hypothetical protein
VLEAARLELRALRLRLHLLLPFLIVGAVFFEGRECRACGSFRSRRGGGGVVTYNGVQSFVGVGLGVEFLAHWALLRASSVPYRGFEGPGANFLRGWGFVLSSGGERTGAFRF